MDSSVIFQSLPSFSALSYRDDDVAAFCEYDFLKITINIPLLTLWQGRYCPGCGCLLPMASRK